MTITIEYSLDTARYVLMWGDGRMSSQPAGPRLFRAPPHPAISFSHASPDEAERDAAKLRAYLAALPTKRQSKKEIREVGA